MMMMMMMMKMMIIIIMQLLSASCVWLWAVCFTEITLFDMYSKLHKVHFIIPFTEEETKIIKHK